MATDEKGVREIVKKIEETITKLEGQDRRCDEFIWERIKNQEANVDLKAFDAFLKEMKPKTFKGASKEISDISMAILMMSEKDKSFDLTENAGQLTMAYSAELSNKEVDTFAATMYLLHFIGTMIKAITADSIDWEEDKEENE